MLKMEEIEEIEILLMVLLLLDVAFAMWELCGNKVCGFLEGM